MTLEKAYLMRKQECLSLQRENRKLTDTIDQLRKGSYTDPEKISHIKQISTLTRKLTEKDKIRSLAGTKVCMKRSRKTHTVFTKRSILWKRKTSLFNGRLTVWKEKSVSIPLPPKRRQTPRSKHCLTKLPVLLHC